MIDETLIQEIDNMHKVANDAQQHKNFNSYMNVFTDNLQYKQLSGKTIEKKQLANDVKRYFERVKSISGSYQRKEINSNAGKVTEKLIQHSQVSIRVFVFFSKNWTVEREAIYDWVKENSEWKIYRVEVLAEKIF
ncbi:hypothetical protein [Mucilaginibacter sp. FT3.2]|uniref:hypothetical protein n=1 Tax=Mucilaginibacter sp. FT3.2 TaxID=2723090 RepID=UPI001618C9A5|nr:hypothetical protein [Mucilaginibacter sp. FT3.2]MBB6232862.1 hypothetical protein [Mucilaginibacter sp. FT3.2]